MPTFGLNVRTASYWCNCTQLLRVRLVKAGGRKLGTLHNRNMFPLSSNNHLAMVASIQLAQHYESLLS
jgi:hypothetical protein